MLRRLQFQVQVVLFCVGALPAVALPASAQVMSVHTELHHDVSPAVRDLPRIAQGKRTRHEAEPVRSIPLPPGLKPPGEPDSVLQTTSALGPSLLTPAVSLSFEGIGEGEYGFTIGVQPPDTNGAVGLTQYVQWANSSFAVFDKATGTLTAGATLGNSLWTGFGGSCETDNDGDGIVLYDKLANRWIISQFAVDSAPYFECLAVSTTSDATGTYNRYSYSYSDYNDYPKMGIWPDAYYETFNNFTSGVGSFVGANACAFDRNAMLAGLTPATQICFQQAASVGGLLPADLDGIPAPPAGSPNYLMNYGTNALNLYKFHVDFTTPSSSTFTGPTSISVAPFSPLCGGNGACVPQPGSTEGLDSLADRLMYRLSYRNFGTHESLVVNHSVVAGTSGGVRWYEIQDPGGTPVVAQQSTFAPDASYRWMGSIAMDHAGNMALGYSVSNSTSLDPSIAYTGRLATDPLSTMEAEVTVVTGGGTQTNTGGSGYRWGDYSAMALDPSDGCTFWYTQEYMKTTGDFNWSTRIASFSFPSCAGSTDNGDPHITTTNGIHYNFQGAGEYVALRNLDGLEIQTRQSPIATTYEPGADGYDGIATCVSLNTAVAARVAGHRVSYEPNLSGVPDPSGMQLRVDGVLTTLSSAGLNLGSGGHVAPTSAPGGLEIDFPDSDILYVTPGWWASQSLWYLNVDVLQMPPAYGGGGDGNVPRAIVAVPSPGGLLAAITSPNWLSALPDGTQMGPMPASVNQRYTDLYHKFGDAWRITDGTSLFDYAPGTSTSTFIVPTWPPLNAACTIPGIKPVQPTRVGVAEHACSAVTGKTAYADCVFDVTVTGNLGFGKTYVNSGLVTGGGTNTGTNSITPSTDKFAVFLDLGAGIPQGTFSSGFNTGFSFNAGVEYLINSYASVEGIFGYHHFPGDMAGSVDIYQFSANAKFYLATSQHSLRPFVNAGVGDYKLSPGPSKLGANVGGGILYQLNSSLGIQGSYNFHNVNTSVNATRFSTVQGGIRFQF